MNLAKLIEELLVSSRRHLGDKAAEKISQAIDMACKFHEKQVRKLDRAPYVTHCLQVAQSCLEWGLTDTEAVCAALLHDALEDAPPEMEPERHIREFNSNVLTLVEALSKIRSLQTGSGDLPATYRRILMAASLDLRVLLIKIFDVLHNSQTLEVHGPAKAKNKASLALIYVGVSRRLGIMELADTLIDYTLPHIMPMQYRRAKKTLDDLLKRGESSMERLSRNLDMVIGEGLAESFVIEPKKISDFFYLTEKPGTGRLLLVGWPAYRLRLLVEDDDTAWRVLGKMHSLFGPLPRHVRDYLNAPRVNGFRALTTRIIWDGHPLNIHVVRKADERANRLGVLAQWGVSGPDQTPYMRLLATLGDSDLRMSEVHAHVLPDMLDVYTPKGDRFTFPVDSVVVDFAYIVHTELGERCIGAKINGIQRPPEYPMADGDVIRILTSKGARPQRSWLDCVKTARARTLIKQALKNQEATVRGINRNAATGTFQLTSLTGQDILWSTCCLATPGMPIVGRLSEDGRWIVHCADCIKIQGSQWEKGQWAIQPGSEALLITFTVRHRAGALLEVLELLATMGINGQTIQGKGRTADIYVISMEMDGKKPAVLGKLLHELLRVSAVQEILSYGWRQPYDTKLAQSSSQRESHNQSRATQQNEFDNGESVL
ncbi:MAG: bifunctional (p)ppGpp synthetase/guanosine-3',5'-bis(diphosphate) 3'-pyrophosphohydrolase [Magnetococcales bacterium]|nr:bifunctional (p)ppGpp synthetase/guanosine-3',5'-bis(diphosphate) 3'-pyrophosphohydrolase [Magnetococcales bacterium]